MRTILAIGLLFPLLLWGSFFKELYPILGGYTDSRFILVAVVSFGVVAFFGKAPPRCSLALVGGVIFCLGIIVSLHTSKVSNPHSSVEALFYPSFLAAVAGFAALFRGYDLPACLIPLYALIGGMMFYAFMTPAEYLFAVFDDISRIDQFLPWGYVNIRYWSHLSSWLLPILPLAVLVGPLQHNRLWRLGIAVTAGIWWWLVLLSSARGSVLSIMVGVVVCLIFFGKHVKPWLVVWFRQIGVGVLFWIVLSVLVPWWLMGDLELRSISMSSSGRVRLWAEAWAMSLQHFPFGMGPQSWLTHEVLTVAYEEGKRLGHPHNMYLMWAAEYGWLAILGLGLIGVGGVCRILKVRKNIVYRRLNFEQSQLIVALSISVVAACFHAGASAVFIAPASMLVGVVILSVFWGALSHPRFLLGDLIPPTSSPLSFWRLGLVCLVLGGVLFWSTEVIRYHQSMNLDRDWYIDNMRRPMVPRFWNHGYYPRNPEFMPESSH